MLVRLTRVLAVVIGIALLVAAIGCSGGTGEPDVQTTVEAKGKQEVAVSPTPIQRTAIPKLDAITLDTSFRPSLSAQYDVVLESGTIYGTGKTGDGQRVELVLDIAVPNTETAALRPLMVQIHGGAFKKGSRIGFGKDLFDRAAQRGWVVASIDYRLTGDDPLPGPQMQEMLDAMGNKSDPGQYRAAVAAVEDTIVSLHYLLGRGEELHLDSSRIVLVGASAGAITALNVAYASDNFGIDHPEIAATVALWGAIHEDLGGESTMDHGEAPLFIVHGTEDEVVPFSYALDLVKGAKSAGIRHEFHPQKGAQHGFNDIDLRTNTTDDGRDLESAMFEFLDQVLY